jgi:hypothetical protein
MNEVVLLISIAAIIISLVLVAISRQVLRDAHEVLDRALDQRAEIDLVLCEAERKIAVLEATQNKW